MWALGTHSILLWSRWPYCPLSSPSALRNAPWRGVRKKLASPWGTPSLMSSFHYITRMETTICTTWNRQPVTQTSPQDTPPPPSDHYSCIALMWPQNRSRKCFWVLLLGPLLSESITVLPVRLTSVRGRSGLWINFLLFDVFRRTKRFLI